MALSLLFIRVGVLFSAAAGVYAVSTTITQFFNNRAPDSGPLVNGGCVVWKHGWGFGNNSGNDRAVLMAAVYDWVRLMTCEMYNPFTGEYLSRRMVRAVLVSVE